MSRIYAALAFIAIIGAVGYWVYDLGYDAAVNDFEAQRQELQERLFRASEEISRKSAEIEAMRESRENLVKELENAARKDPDNRRPGIGAAGMSRLERRWRRGED